MGLIFVDCEAYGPCPSQGQLTEFAAIDYDTWHKHQRWNYFHGQILETIPDPKIPAIPVPTGKVLNDIVDVFDEFAEWLDGLGGRPIFVSDNPAYDWQWINDGFWNSLGSNPFGHSGRRIGDFYAGIKGDFFAKQNWKHLRKTKHDHNPVHDCQGNIEAFEAIRYRQY